MTSPSSSPALVLDGLGVQYGNITALSDVHVVVEARSVHGIIGPNGAGKTTLMDASTGFISHATGKVSVGGVNVEHLSPHQRVRAGLRRTFQQSRAPEDVPISRYIHAVARRRVPDGELAELLGMIGSPDPAALLGDLDVPRRRLVEFVAAVAGRPAVLMLDEPAAGLGEQESIRLARTIAELPERYGMAVLVIEHDMDLVRGVCAQVTVLDYGRQIGSGSPGVVLHDPKVKLAYLGAEDEQ
ncbi:ABC transporter ATP-binding protein [Streptomyces sp. NPDC048179]|uniref:ABC transporter ATP-binding protein n=1 Tax=Streptomyces sp. NPDC048179 TaxID=3365506 RepID=UPI00371496E1